MTRIGPEQFMWIPSECGKTSPPWKCDEPPSEDAKDFNSKNGFWITESSYNLRPEVIESYYYAYRMSKDEKYRDWAWDAWQAINKTHLEHGFNYLVNVNTPDGTNRVANNQESYFFSETLKYLFLIFSDNAEWHVNFKGQNQWVYNTEGHPFQIRRQTGK
jgi:mannosyl-oligosaccharide alpha-1,2-mannosidase